MLEGRLKWDEDLPFESRQVREMFACFGLAVYKGQCLEEQIRMVLSYMYKQDILHTPPSDRDSFYDEEVNKTLGQMAKKLQGKANLSQALEKKLCQAIAIRNRLVHHYFREHAEDEVTFGGREKIIFDLQKQADFLGETDKEFTDILKAWIQRMGVSKTELKKFIETQLLEMKRANRCRK